jgi:hypothetical protein
MYSCPLEGLDIVPVADICPPPELGVTVIVKVFPVIVPVPFPLLLLEKVIVPLLITIVFPELVLLPPHPLALLTAKSVIL